MSNRPTETLAFAAKIDTWLLVLIAGSALGCVYAAGSVAFSGEPARWVIAGILLLSAAGMIWVLGSTTYTLTKSELRVRCGPFRWRVPLSEIRGVTPTRNPLSSPAPSLDRLRIEYGRGGSIMISPTDKDGFLRELESRRSALGHQGESERSP